MPAHTSNPTSSSTGAAGKRSGISVLRAVPVSTTRVPFIAEKEGHRTVGQWLAATCSLRESDLGAPFKMKRSYARMGSTRGSLDVRFTKPEFQVGGANVIGSLANTYRPLSTGSFPPIPASPVFSDLESDASSCFSPPMPSEIPRTPVVAALSDGEGRVTNLMRWLDYRGAHEGDAIEAVRLEQPLETQKRNSSM
ncbi:hypothetical protein FRC06_010219 [Ceratobasidium sp. 370]|nr:hypothetical protein FRC06_010219 [Ceratobasidium sp. 370]